MKLHELFVLSGALASAAVPAAAQEDVGVETRNDSVLVHFVDADLRAAVQALGRHLDRPVVFGDITAARVTLETPSPVPRAEVAALLRSLLEAHNLELVDDSTFYRVRPREDVALTQLAEGVPQDRPQGAIQLFVIRLRHARAADVAATVNALYGRAGALGELGTQPPTLNEQLEQQRIPSIDDPPEPEQLAPVATAELTGDVTIVPDLRTNSLLVRATQQDFALIEAAVQELDVRPLQVLIEVIIAEVRKDRSFAFGMDVSTSSPQPVRGAEGAKYEVSSAGLGLGDFVLRVMNLGGADLDVTLAAAASRGDARILSRPVLLAANNERAEILVGAQRPFVQVQRALPTDAGVRDQVIQYRDVGTLLSVRPTISPDGYVMLEVTQEVNAATSEVAFNAPVISTRSVQTHLLVRDRQTAVIGGLVDRQRETIRTGVPVLSSIPVIGGLFGSTSRRMTETELFVFLTPRVIATDDDIDDARDAAREGVGDVQLPIRR